MTPLHNVFQYTSNVRKSLTCPENRTEIRNNFGVINIPPRCFVQTENFIIKGNLDETTITKRFSKIELENVETLLNVSTSRNFTNNKDEEIKFTPNDETIDDAIKEASELKIMDYIKSSHLILIVVNITLISVAIIVCCIYNKKKKTSWYNVGGL